MRILAIDLDLAMPLTRCQAGAGTHPRRGDRAAGRVRAKWPCRCRMPRSRTTTVSRTSVRSPLHRATRGHMDVFQPASSAGVP